MKFDPTFLRSKVAQRIFILFILCALIPITALAILSFSQVTQQLNEQSRDQLRHATKGLGLAVYERLLTLEDQMKLVASNMALGSGAPPPALPYDLSENLSERFKGLVLIKGNEKPFPCFGHIQDAPALSPSEKDYLRAGKTLVTTQSNSGLPACIFMSRVLDPKDPKAGRLLGQINLLYLLDLDEETSIPLMAKLSVLDQSNNPLYSSPEVGSSILQQVASTLHRSSVGQLELEKDGSEYIVSYWTVFLQPRFFVPKWTVVLTESKSDVLAPMTRFTRIFPLVILLSLLVVVYLSVIQIRRSLIPLEKLQEGTKQIAKSDFESPVTIQSGDEFEDLAASFNAMASRLGKQFKALTAMSEIDRAILSTLDTRKIVNTLLTRIPDVFPCDCVSVTLIEPDNPSSGRIHLRANKPWSEIRVKTVRFQPEEIRKIHDCAESFFVTYEDLPEHLAPLTEFGTKSFLVLPIFIKDKMAGIIHLGYLIPPVLIQDDLDQVRRLADQMAVALSNASLIKELNQLNLGTLIAFARTIDAKSPWTAGHSERVTNLALEIGKTLGLSPKQLDVLHRGGLLHDAGKIGIPAEILDKPTRLTDEESRIMREHVRIGARILEPIAAYADVMPIVLQHHEWFDGGGYPSGISGETIHLNARIFAVADYFDAMTSDRPYRIGIDDKETIHTIQQKAGSHFDPKVVEAFLEVMAQRDREGGRS
ncbi:MAG: HD domain-containing phosphohydrolase [Thermodesulfobacteriota bacterium]